MRQCRVPAIAVGLLLIFCQSAMAGTFNNNLFNPYDILLFKPLESHGDFVVAYEGAFHVKAFQADPDDRINATEQKHSNVFRRKAEVLQLWHNEQDFCAALQGAPHHSPHAAEASLLNIKNQKIICGLRVSGDLSVPMNLMLSARFALPYDLTLAFYLPVLLAEFKNITWAEHDAAAATTFAGRFGNFVERLEKIGSLNLSRNWRRTGIGDFATLVWWNNTYLQDKEWLKDVGVCIRGGVTFPSGARKKSDHLFDLPFGHDAGLGILFGGNIELGFGRYLKLGIDGEFHHFLGSKREHRIQTDKQQTDLLFANKANSHTQPGLLQHYTLFLKLGGLVPGLSGTIAYQHNRQHEDKIILDSARFNSLLANNAENLQDWTTHTIVGMLDYEFTDWLDCDYMPAIKLFAKNGFNGKRALLFDTAGFQINCRF